MSKLKTLILSASITGLAIATLTSASAAFLPSDSPFVVDLGATVAGQSYQLTVTGISNLYAPTGLTFDADGKPTYVFSDPYAAFNPNGLDHDPTGSSFPGTGGYAQAGIGINAGALVGTYSQTGGVGALGSFFLLGSTKTFVAVTTGELYGVINDTYYPDNPSTGFSVSLAPITAAVP